MARLKLRGAATGFSIPGKLAIGMVFLLLVGAAYFVIFYGDVETAITQAEEQHGALQGALDAAEQSKTQYQKDRDEKERREQKLNKQKKSLPDESEWPSFLSTVQSLATISGIKLTSWKPNDEQIEDFYVRLPMELVIEGKYHQVAKFFNSVGQAERIINMENIHLALAKAAPGATLPAALRQENDAAEAQEANVVVEVKCLASAFRALKAEEVGKSKRKKGATGAQSATPPPAAPPPAAGGPTK